MTHPEWREQILLSLYGELEVEEQRSVESHLAECESCREEVAQLQQLHRLVDTGRAPAPNALLLLEARQNLQAILRYERGKRSSLQRARQWASEKMGSWSPALYPRTAMAFGSVVLFAGGVLVGQYGITAPLAVVGVVGEPKNVSEVFNSADLDITNVQFVDSDVSDGSVEFVFDAVHPVHVKGAIDDPRVQRVLAYAVVNDKNPGVRLRVVNTAGGYAPPSADSEIKRALIIALKSDPNTGVRKEAFNSLEVPVR